MGRGEGGGGENYKEKILKKIHARGIALNNIPTAALKFPTQTP